MGRRYFYIAITSCLVILAAESFLLYRTIQDYLSSEKPKTEQTLTGLESHLDEAVEKMEDELSIPSTTSTDELLRQAYRCQNNIDSFIQNTYDFLENQTNSYKQLNKSIQDYSNTIDESIKYMDEIDKTIKGQENRKHNFHRILEEGERRGVFYRIDA